MTTTQSHIQASLVEALRQGECLLESLPDSAYNRRVPEAFNATIGGHYRHCLDHFEAILREEKPSEVDYDARRRDPGIETDREKALSRTRELLRHFEGNREEENFSRPVKVRCKVSYLGDESPVALSSLAREAMYAVVHAIHHYALIGIMCRLQEVSLPEGFGVAPSTVKHRKDQAGRSGSEVVPGSR